MLKPRADLRPNTAEYETTPLVKATGFREYDARWVLEKEINLLGIQALGLGLATYVHEIGQRPKIVVGHDYRSYSLSVKQALMLGLLEGGMEVLDIGLALSPTAYFAQFELDAPCVAMVTASHNENGWTGVKMGAHPPLTFGPDEIGRLKEIVLNGEGVSRAGGTLKRIEGFREKYIADIVSKVKLTRPIKVVAACGNGTAGAFAPEALRRMGCEVIEMDTELDYTFPKYNPNPEDHAMLMQMAAKVRETGADLALGFDGDGDRCGVVDNTGEEIFADKIGLMLGRDLSALHPNATFVVDVKSTGLYKTDEVLKANGATTVYWKTGHSYIKRKTSPNWARWPGFEKSGHFFFNAPLGHGYDDGIVAAGAVLAMLDRNPGKTLSRAEGGPAGRLDQPDHVAPLRRRAEVRGAGADRGRVSGAGRRGRVDPGPQDRRGDHRQRRARASGGRQLGAGPRLVEQAGAGGGGREHALGRRHARPVPRGGEAAAGEIRRSRGLQSGDLTAGAPRPHRVHPPGEYGGGS
jgi:phosphomannomutase/phosphoglucomutase